MKEKESAADSIRKQVVPLVDVVSLCAKQELAMIKVDSITRVLEKHDVEMTPYWRSKNYPFVFSELELSCSYVVYRKLGLAYRLDNC